MLKKKRVGAAGRGGDPQIKTKVEEFIDETVDSLDNLEEFENEKEVITNGKSNTVKQQMYRKKVKKIVKCEDGTEVEEDVELDEQEVKKRKEEYVKKSVKE